MVFGLIAEHLIIEARLMAAVEHDIRSEKW
jgi:hypothetical protein